MPPEVTAGEVPCWDELRELRSLLMDAKATVLARLAAAGGGTDEASRASCSRPSVRSPTGDRVDQADDLTTASRRPAARPRSSAVDPEPHLFYPDLRLTHILRRQTGCTADGPGGLPCKIMPKADSPRLARHAGCLRRF